MTKSKTLIAQQMFQATLEGRAVVVPQGARFPADSEVVAANPSMFDEQPHPDMPARVRITSKQPLRINGVSAHEGDELRVPERDARTLIAERRAERI